MHVTISDFGYLALVASAFFAIFGARASQSRAALSATVLALQGRLDANRDEMDELKQNNVNLATDLRAAQAETARLSGTVATLNGLVTAHDDIARLDAVTRAGFSALGVDGKLLVAAGGAG